MEHLPAGKKQPTIAQSLGASRGTRASPRGKGTVRAWPGGTCSAASSSQPLHVSTFLLRCKRPASQLQDLAARAVAYTGGIW